MEKEISIAKRGVITECRAMSEECELKVYVKPGCPWCIDVVAWLRKSGHHFRILDVYADASLYEEMRRLSGQDKAPTVVWGDLVLADCGVDELVPFLREHGIEP